MSVEIKTIWGSLKTSAPLCAQMKTGSGEALKPVLN
jgi:hypothetical protein